MNISQDIKAHAADMAAIAAETDAATGMKEMSEKFKQAGAEIYQ
jgi:hypothetical protein